MTQAISLDFLCKFCLKNGQFLFLVLLPTVILVQTPLETGGSEKHNSSHPSHCHSQYQVPPGHLPTALLLYNKISTSGDFA